MEHIKVSVIGASGYGGAETVRLLATHPHVWLVHVTAETQKGLAISHLYPNLRGFVDQEMIEADLPRIGSASDVTIVSLPSGMAMNLVPELLKQGSKVIDVAADFRLKQADLYPQWYKVSHTAPEYLGE
ncbi:MAG TPA: N-acetyl-gamma-glutamyl-phosphate reductase, partial [Gammaproteobacteria bacterium]|nr:N-acetyl-gamma-glutamyl-phosphate reductase [Gammaproteobacteria bacterium]